MYKMRPAYQIIFLGICMLCSLNLTGQAGDDGITLHQIFDSLYLEENTDVSQDAILEKERPWNFKTTLGTSVSFIPGYGAGTSVFAAPHVDFSATQRLSFHGGFIASLSFPVYSMPEGENGYMKPFTNLSAFVAASYRLTDDLVVYGSGMKSMINPGFIEGSSNFSMDNFSLGAAYSIGNFTFGASISSGYRNLYNTSPFNQGRGFYPSPFYW